MKTIKISPNTVFALLFSGMGFMLLLVMVIFERSAFNLLFDIQAEKTETIVPVFNALRLVIHVMPYTLGPFILGTFLFGLLQSYRSKWSLVPTLSLVVFVAIIAYNIFFADTATVVETLKNTTNEHTEAGIRFATQGVMRQHHVGIIGFGFFLFCQIGLVFHSIPRSKEVKG